MSFLFSAPVDIDIVLEDGDSRETVEVKNKSSKERVPLYKDGESVRGAVTIRPKDGKRLEHTGIKVQFIGMIGTSHLPGQIWSKYPHQHTNTQPYRDVL